ncbi:unnamed protein product [Schistosoma haematobium]|nr:unnamed protein product [Schistosoma haematobium]
MLRRKSYNLSDLFVHLGISAILHLYNNYLRISNSVTTSQYINTYNRDKVHKRGWRSKERLASQALSDVTNIINDSSTST